MSNIEPQSKLEKEKKIAARLWGEKHAAKKRTKEGREDEKENKKERINLRDLRQDVEKNIEGEFINKVEDVRPEIKLAAHKTRPYGANTDKKHISKTRKKIDPQNEPRKSAARPSLKITKTESARNKKASKNHIISDNNAPTDENSKYDPDENTPSTEPKANNNDHSAKTQETRDKAKDIPAPNQKKHAQSKNESAEPEQNTSASDKKKSETENKKKYEGGNKQKSDNTDDNKYKKKDNNKEDDKNNNNDKEDKEDNNKKNNENGEKNNEKESANKNNENDVKKGEQEDKQKNKRDKQSEDSPNKGTADTKKEDEKEDNKKPYKPFKDPKETSLTPKTDKKANGKKEDQNGGQKNKTAANGPIDKQKRLAALLKKGKNKSKKNKKSKGGGKTQKHKKKFSQLDGFTILMICCAFRDIINITFSFIAIIPVIGELYFAATLFPIMLIGYLFFLKQDKDVRQKIIDMVTLSSASVYVIGAIYAVFLFSSFIGLWIVATIYDHFGVLKFAAKIANKVPGKKQLAKKAARANSRVSAGAQKK